MEKVSLNYRDGLFNPHKMATTPKELGLGDIIAAPAKDLKYVNNRKPPLPSPIKQDPSACICERKLRHILCRSCGFVWFGRIRAACAAHPKVIHLMDISCCPKCRACLLKEFQIQKPKD